MSHAKNTWIDLSDVNFGDVETLNQEGARAIPDFAASSSETCNCGTCSCGGDEPTQELNQN